MINHIVDNIYIGNADDAYRNKDYFITFTVAKESNFKGQHYYPLIDSFHPENEKLLEDAITDLIITRRNTSEPILVHCRYGFSRSPTVVIGYMLVNGWGLSNSYDYVKMSRPAVNINPAMWDLLKSYEKY